MLLQIQQKLTLCIKNGVPFPITRGLSSSSSFSKLGAGTLGEDLLLVIWSNFSSHLNYNFRINNHRPILVICQIWEIPDVVWCQKEIISCFLLSFSLSFFFLSSILPFFLCFFYSFFLFFVCFFHSFLLSTFLFFFCSFLLSAFLFFIVHF